MSVKSFKGFYRFTEPESRDKNLEEQFNIVQKVEGDGVEYEFMISFYKYNKKLAVCPPSKNGHKKASKNEMNRSISLIY